MYEKNNPKEKIIEKAKIKSRIHPLHRFLFFISFIILSFLFNIEAIALVNENFKYKTFYLKMISFFILCLFPITEYDKMKSIMIFLPSLVLLFFHVTFIPLSPMFLSFLCFFTKIYSLAYLRIWIDQFAMIKFKTLFIYILNIFALSGDKISMVINKYINYKKILNNILIIQFVIFVVFFMIPDKFFFIHNKLVHYRTKIAELKEKENEMKLIMMKKKTKKLKKMMKMKVFLYLLIMNKKKSHKEKQKIQNLKIYILYSKILVIYFQILASQVYSF